MKTILFIAASLVSLTVFSNTAYSQSCCSKEDSLHTFNIYLINGYALSYNIFENEHSAFRVQLDLTSSFNENTEDQSFDRPEEEEYSRDRNSINNMFSLSLAGQYLLNIYKSTMGKIYLGGGPLLSYNRTRYNYSFHQLDENNNINDYSNESQNIQDSYSAGLTFVMGIKGNLSKTIFVFAEAHLRGGRSWNDSIESHSNSSNNYSNNYTIETDGTGWFYNLNAFRLGIGISI